MPVITSVKGTVLSAACNVNSINKISYRCFRIKILSKLVNIIKSDVEGKHFIGPELQVLEIRQASSGSGFTEIQGYKRNQLTCQK